MSWFPAPMSLMEKSREFQALTIADKVFLLFLMSSFNLHGPFGLSDFTAASLLGVKPATIQRSRRKLKVLGWINHKPGYISSEGRAIASRYL